MGSEAEREKVREKRERKSERQRERERVHEKQRETIIKRVSVCVRERKNTYDIDCIVILIYIFFFKALYIYLTHSICFVAYILMIVKIIFSFFRRG